MATEELELKERTRQLAAMKAQVQAELKGVLPALDSAQAGVITLADADVAELKKMASPTEAVLLVVQVGGVVHGSQKLHVAFLLIAGPVGPSAGPACGRGLLSMC